MIIIFKIKLLYHNATSIYGHSYSRKELLWTIFLSVIFLPLYYLFITILSAISLLLLFLYLPFYLVKIILGDTWGIDDPIMGIVMLPISIAYFGVFLISFLPYLVLGFLCDLFAEIISRDNHGYDYIIIWPSVFVAPHKESYPSRYR